MIYSILTRQLSLEIGNHTLQSTLAAVMVIFSVVGSSTAFAQVGEHPAAKQAFEKIVLEKDFGEQLKFHSREIVTMAKNEKMPGLNGLMFMRWKGDQPGEEVLASVQWFEQTKDLLSFYETTTAREDHKRGNLNGTAIWKIGENGYTWTDGKHFMVSLGGSPPPPEEMIKEWLTMIPSNLEELEKGAEDKPAGEVLE